MAGTVTPLAGADFATALAGSGTASDEGNDFALGTRIATDDGKERMYVHASAAIAQNRVVAVDETGEAQEATEALAIDGWQLGCAADVALADNEFGWIVTRAPDVDVYADAVLTVDQQVYWGATPGALGNTTTTGLISGIIPHTANTAAGVVGCIMTFPKGATG